MASVISGNASFTRMSVAIPSTLAGASARQRTARGASPFYGDGRKGAKCPSTIFGHGRPAVEEKQAADSALPRARHNAFRDPVAVSPSSNRRDARFFSKGRTASQQRQRVAAGRRRKAPAELFSEVILEERVMASACVA